MKNIVWIGAASTLFLASCASFEGGRDNPDSPFIQVLPEAVLKIAAPYQDLTAVQIDPADGCYVYRYAGPVETTFLPLRSVSGRPICTRAPEVKPG